MRSTTLLGLTLLLLSPLARPQTTRPVSPAEPVVLTMRCVDGGGEAQATHLRGRTCGARVIIHNRSAGLVILRGITLAGQLPDLEPWYGSRYGAVTHDVGEDAWIHDGLQQQLSRPIFASTLVWPGESLTVERSHTCLDSGLRLEVHYQYLDLAQASEQLYLPVTSNPMQTVYRKLELTAATLDDVREGLAAEGAIFPAADQWPVEGATLVMALELEEGPFPLLEAQKKLGALVREAVYWESEQAWVVTEAAGDRVWLVGPERVVELPRCDLLAFPLVDAAGGEISMILPLAGYHGFGARPPRIEGPGYVRLGITTVPRSSLLELLERARQRGEALRVATANPNGLGPGLRLVLGELDEARRGAVARGEYAAWIWAEQAEEDAGPEYLVHRYGTEAPDRCAEVTSFLEALAGLPEGSRILQLRVPESCAVEWPAEFESLCEQRGLKVETADD
jgi:hypothetical protein